MIMPNWCENRLVITGKRANIRRLFYRVGLKNDEPLDEFLFNNKITMRSWMPMPKTFINYDTTNDRRGRNAIDPRTNNPLFKTDEEYKEYCDGYYNAMAYQRKTYGVIGWYDYNVKTLGVKWDAGLNEYARPIVSEDETSVSFTFDTAWNEPGRWLTTLIHIYKSLRFEMDSIEEGCGYHVRMIGYDGIIQQIIA